ncbi:unnamed protein product [Effrenium voratum]|nr:unnamed protein product [Effrenium voratum]
MAARRQRKLLGFGPRWQSADPTESLTRAHEVEQALQNLKEVCQQQQKVQRHGQAECAAELGEAIRLTRRRGQAVESFGRREDGQWLLELEEALYLAERGSLEAQALEAEASSEPAGKRRRLSVPELYRRVAEDPQLDLDAYLVYSHLRRSGYRVTRPAEGPDECVLASLRAAGATASTSLEEPLGVAVAMCAKGSPCFLELARPLLPGDPGDPEPGCSAEEAAAPAVAPPAPPPEEEAHLAPSARYAAMLQRVASLARTPNRGATQGISVHIRAPNTLDWCSALRKRLTETAPGQAAGLKETKPPKAPRVFEYSKHTLPNSHIVYNVPKVSPAEAEGETGADPRLLGRNASGKVLEPARSGMTMISRPAPGMLPEEAVVLQVTGPFGAPAQKVWGFDTLMVVGAGIGVTPFASILRSVQLRARQRETIMSAATRPSAWRNMVKNEAEDSRASLQKLVEDLVVIPKKIYFYWICRGQEEFDWFCDLLADAAEGPHAGIVDITLFLTGEIELSQVKKLPCASGQFFGRPNWGRIFKQNREKHQGEHVGVFLCGSPIIGEELSRQSVKHSDLVGTPHATRFSFFKEHF